MLTGRKRVSVCQSVCLGRAGHTDEHTNDVNKAMPKQREVVVVSRAATHDADEAPRCGTHFQLFLGLCWAVLTHLEPQSRKNGRSRKHCKTQYS